MLWLRKALARWSSVLEPVRAPEGARRLNYRNKTVLFAQPGEKGWELGMRIPIPGNRGEYEFVPIPRCPVHSVGIQRILEYLSDHLPVDLKLAFVSVTGSLVTLVLKQAPCDLKELSELFDQHSSALRERGVEGIYVNFNPSAGHRVFLGHWNSRNWKKIFGNNTAIGSLDLVHGPRSFQQLIPELYENALVESEAWLQPGSGKFVLDLYTGLGASLRRWLKSGAETLGVELLGEAVELAGGPILQGRASERLPQLGARVSAFEGELLLFTNPPRSGMEEKTLDWVGQEIRPTRIAYLSCSAGTLARDLSKLENCAYRVKRIIPYDFFPQTHHVETLALLGLDSRCGDAAAISR